MFMCLKMKAIVFAIMLFSLSLFDVLTTGKQAHRVEETRYVWCGYYKLSNRVLRISKVFYGDSAVNISHGDEGQEQTTKLPF